MALLDENLVAELARRGIVTDTFRRLPTDKKRQVYQGAIRLFGEYAVSQQCIGSINA